MAIFSAIIGAITSSAWFAGLGAIARIGVGIALSVGANALSRAFADERDRPKPRGVVTTVQQGADVPRSFILGRYATRGSLAYHNTWGEADVPGDGIDDESPNAYLTRVIALSDLPVRGLARVFVDGEPVTLDMGNPDPGGRGFPVVELEANDTDTRIEPLPGGGLGVSDYTSSAYSAWVKFYDGTQTQADLFVRSKVATEERPWGGNCIGRGVAYAVVTCLLDREQFQGIPDFLFEIDGLELPDPATGQVGTGDHLSAVQVAAVLRGFEYDGQWVWGPQGRGASRYRASEWAAPVEECRAGVPGAGAMPDAERIEAFGSTTIPPRYRSGLEIAVDQKPADVIEDLLAACGGRLAEIGTRYIMQVGDPGAAALTIRDADIISTEGQEFTPFLGIAESVNGVSATYPDPEQGWQVQNAPPLYVDEYEDEDGGRRLLTDAPLAAVPFKEQVQRLQWSVLNEARRARRHSIVLPPRFVGLLPLDYIGWDSDRNGYEGKVFRVDGVTPLINGNVAVDLTEVDPEDYNWDASSQFLPVVAGSLTPQGSFPLAVTGFEVLTSSVPDSVGVRAPALELLWARGRLSGVRGIEWQIRVRSTGQVVSTGQQRNLSARRVLVSEGIGRNHEYEARARYLPRGATKVEWTDWYAAYSGDVGIPKRDLAGELQAEIDAAIALTDKALENFETGPLAELRDAAITPTFDRIRPLSERIDLLTRQMEEDFFEEAIGALAEQRVTAFEARAEQRNSLATVRSDVYARIDADASAEAAQRLALEVQVEAARAAVIEESRTRASADAAEAAARQSLTAEIGGFAAAIQTESAVRADADGALATRIDQVEASAGENSAAITTLQGTKVDAAGAVAAINQTVSAEYGSMKALAKATAFAEAGLAGIAEGFVWALGGNNILTLVRVDDGSAPVTTARIDASYIRLTGTTEIAGSFTVGGGNVFLNGDTTVNGNFRLNGNLIVTGTVDTPQLADHSVTVGTDALVSDVEIEQSWGIVARLTFNPQGKRVRVFSQISIRGRFSPGGADGVARFRVRRGGETLFSRTIHDFEDSSAASVDIFYIDPFPPNGNTQYILEMDGVDTNYTLDQGYFSAEAYLR